MDLIVKGQIEELTSTDMYMLEFISELVSQTNRGEVAWSREKLHEGNNQFYDYQSQYCSMFYEEANGDKNEPALCAQLPGSDSRLYIGTVKMLFGDGIGQKFAEVYLVDTNGNRTALYNTYDNKVLLEETRILYSSAKKASKNIKLAENAKSVIDQFMATRR